MSLRKKNEGLPFLITVTKMALKIFGLFRALHVSKVILGARHQAAILWVVKLGPKVVSNTAMTAECNAIANSLQWDMLLNKTRRVRFNICA